MEALSLASPDSRSLGGPVAYLGALLYVAFLIAVHIAQPHMLHEGTISKYALGHDGWLMQAAFISAGLGFAGVASLLRGRAAVALWIGVVAFVVMGLFKIDSVGPNNVVSLHGALHTIAFFAVVLLVHPAMFVLRRRFASRPLSLIAYAAPLLVVVGFAAPGLFGALVFRAWTLSLVAWVVLAAGALETDRFDAGFRR
ncbi:MAG TPA: DUF998 domain-containing protein [Thermoleophilaceae bacterium]|nr:DUF998 domain-containing protein [Thermoleophilaceae bacterium]